ncbi:MAG: metalloregulator ArsR/SmtB family transcription factor [Patescibacteria group bacterium]|nr:metalloregulator ArsR/SmtB family transcription factor [Patescibacteria group bacterium]
MNNCSYDCCKPNSKEFQRVVSHSSLLKIISEENRLKILCILKEGEHCVCEIINHLSLSQSLISHHLKDLRDSDIVSDSKKGNKVYYSLTKKGRKLTDILFSFD